MIQSHATGFLTIAIRKADGRRVEIGTFKNLILNGGITLYAAPALPNNPTFYTYTDTSPNYEDLDGTWNQSGNTVTRATGSGTFPSSPSQIGNELLWEDGERCHVTARASDTSITVSGPPRTITGKSIRIYRTNRSSTSGSAQSKSASSGDTVTTEDLTAGTWERTVKVVFDAATVGYTMGSVMIGNYARVVLPAPVVVEEFDQLEMSYKQQITVSGREDHIVPISDMISGYPYRFQTASITGDGSKMVITTDEDHNFMAGDEIVVDGAVPERHEITGITANGSAWTITAPSHGLSPADTIAIEDCSVGDYNGTWTVTTTPDSDTLTITNAANPGAASDGTVRLATPATYFNGRWTVDAVPDTKTIEVLTDRTGPPIDPGDVTTSPDEATLRFWGNFWETSGSGNNWFVAYSEANAATVPSHTSGNTNFPPGPNSSHNGPAGTNQSAAPANDFTSSATNNSASQWGAGGTSVPRLKQIFRAFYNAAGNAGGSVQCCLTFKTPQPKLNTHRLSSPTIHRKFTRDLPNY